MLSALELARRIEAGTLRPRAVVELCAEAIAAHENDIGAFAALGIDAARQRAEEPQRALLRLRGLPVGVKDIFDTATCRPNMARRSMPAIGPRPTRRWSY